MRRFREAYDVILGIGVVIVFLLIISAALSFYKEYAVGTEAQAQIESAQGALRLGIDVTIYMFMAVLMIIAVALFVYVFRRYVPTG